jgi:hypothetical protein
LIYYRGTCWSGISLCGGHSGTFDGALKKIGNNLDLR